MDLKDLLQSGDWKGEKHVPVIEVLEKKDGKVTFQVSVGKEVPHPNTTAHHISWIEVYFLPTGEKFPHLLGRFDLAAHGASTGGADTSGVYTEPIVRASFRTEKGGTLLAKSYCNVHGLWTGSQELEL